MLNDLKQVHVIGIGGIGTSAIAKWLLAKGVRVTGSDVSASRLTRDVEALGARVVIGHDASLVEGADLVMYSAAVEESDPERQQAHELQIRELSYPEFLGKWTKQFKTVVVSGTNGKSTTTAMLGRMLIEAGFDPTVLVGSLVPGWELGNLRLGKSEWLVIEGCEYRAHMLHMHPYGIVITNIEEDHLDYYRDLAHIQATFQTFVDSVDPDGFVVLNGNDPVSMKLSAPSAITCGSDLSMDVTGRGRKVSPGEQSIEVVRPEYEDPLGRLSLYIPGAYNLQNALAATTTAMKLGVSFDICAASIKAFGGIWRRYESVGEFNEALIISDYGHHPTAVRETIQATREFFPKRRLILCFQPHQHSRTKELLNEFALSVVGADIVLIPDIYGVVGRTEPEEREISSEDLVRAAKTVAPEKEILYTGSLKKTEKMLYEMIYPKDVVLVMGAGDVDEIARHLVKAIL